MKPVLQALVLAEHVYTDTTGKKIICGTFNRIRTKRVAIPTNKQADGSDKPTVLIPGTEAGCPFAYISLTDVVTGTKLHLQFVHLSRNQIIFAANITLEDPLSRLATVEIVAPLPAFTPICRNPGPGVYALEVLWDGEILGSHRLVIEEIAQEEGDTT